MMRWEEPPQTGYWEKAEGLNFMGKLTRRSKSASAASKQLLKKIWPEISACV